MASRRDTSIKINHGARTHEIYDCDEIGGQPKRRKPKANTRHETEDGQLSADDNVEADGDLESDADREAGLLAGNSDADCTDREEKGDLSTVMEDLVKYG